MTIEIVSFPINSMVIFQFVIYHFTIYLVDLAINNGYIMTQQ